MRPSLYFIVAVFVIGLIWFVFIDPTFWNSNTKENARRTACLSIVKRLAHASLAYASDHDERFPLGNSWMDILEPTLGGEATPTPDQRMAMYETDDNLHAPPEHRSPDDPLFVTNIPTCLFLFVNGERHGFGYAMNRAMSGQKKGGDPMIPLIFESVQTGRNAVGTINDLPNPSRHDRRDAVAYADGHAKWIRVPKK